MILNNPVVLDHIIDNTGDIQKIDELNNAQIAASTKEALQAVFENQNSSNIHVNRHIVDDTEDTLTPEQLSNAEIDAETFEAKNIIMRNVDSGNIHPNYHIVDQDGGTLELDALTETQLNSASAIADNMVFRRKADNAVVKNRHVFSDNNRLCFLQAKSHAQVLSTGIDTTNFYWYDKSADRFHVPAALVDQNLFYAYPKISAINAWDMDTDITHNVTHGMGADWKDIIGITGCIINDAGSAMYIIGQKTYSGGTLYDTVYISGYDSTYIYLVRPPGSLCTGTNWDNSTNNRGIIFLWICPNRPNLIGD